MQKNVESRREADGLYVRFWGVRGSSCTSGPEFAEFGGNTPCVEIRLGQRLFIIDAGSGIAKMACSLAESLPLHIDLLLSHLHMDHINGLLLSRQLIFNAERTIHTYCGNQNGKSAADALDRQYSPPLYPITLDDVPVRFVHSGFKAGDSLRFEDNILVRTIPLKHPGGSTGYRFDHAGRAVCYLSDLEHTIPWPDPALVEFVRDADLIIFDGMFCDNDYTDCKGWGHSTWNKGIELCRAGEVKSMAIFHLNPCYDDGQLNIIEREMQREMPTAFIARERHSVDLEPKPE